MRLVLILLIAAAVAGCNRGEKEKAPTAARPARPSKQAPRPVYPEPDVVAILHALDTAEIMTARVAREISLNDDVLGFAGVMIKDHGDIMQLVAQTGVTPRENAISAKIRHDADSIARGLSGLTMGLNNTYMEEQVRSHRAALQTLDSVIIPSAQTPALRELLEKLRPAFVAHLQRAMQVLAIRRKETEDRGEQWVSGFNQPEPRETGPRLLGTPVSTPEPTARSEPREAEPRPVQPAPKPKPKPDTQPRIVIPPPDTTPPDTTRASPETTSPDTTPSDSTP